MKRNVTKWKQPRSVVLKSRSWDSPVVSLSSLWAFENWTWLVIGTVGVEVWLNSNTCISYDFCWWWGYDGHMFGVCHSCLPFSNFCWYQKPLVVTFRFPACGLGLYSHLSRSPRVYFPRVPNILAEYAFSKGTGTRGSNHSVEIPVSVFTHCPAGV